MAKKPSAKSNPQASLLASVVNTPDGGPYFYASKEEMAGLYQHPTLGMLVEFSEQLRDPKDNNKIAWRATDAGKTAHTNGVLKGATAAAPAPAVSPWGSSNGGAQPAPQAPKAQPQSNRTFVFDKNVPIPEARRGGRGQDVYGFVQMVVGDSFFVAATEDNPNPAKRIASTCSSASKRMAPKVFIVRSVDETEEGRGRGARVWRTS